MATEENIYEPLDVGTIYRQPEKLPDNIRIVSNIPDNVTPERRPLNDEVDFIDNYRYIQDRNENLRRFLIEDKKPPAEAPEPDYDSPNRLSTYQANPTLVSLTPTPEDIEAVESRQKAIKAFTQNISVIDMIRSVANHIAGFVESGGSPERAADVAMDFAAGGFARGAISKEAAGTIGTFGGRGARGFYLDELSRARMLKRGGANDLTPELDTSVPIKGMGRNNVPLSKEDQQMLKEQEITDNAWMDRFKVDLQLKYEGKDSINKMLENSKGWNDLYDLIDADKIPHSTQIDIFKNNPAFYQYYLQRAEEQATRSNTAWDDFKRSIIKEVDDEMAKELRLIEGGKGKPIEADKVVGWLKDAGITDITVKDVRGTKYIKFNDPNNPKRRSEATPTVRVPEDTHIGRQARESEIGNLFDTGSEANRAGVTNPETTRNISGGGYSAWENLLAALKWRLSKSPDGQWLISPDKAPKTRSKPLENRTTGDTLSRDPNQLEFDFLGPEASPISSKAGEQIMKLYQQQEPISEIKRLIDKFYNPDKHSITEDMIKDYIASQEKP